jgi:hypothetical protein
VSSVDARPQLKDFVGKHFTDWGGINNGSRNPKRLPMKRAPIGNWNWKDLAGNSSDEEIAIVSTRIAV